MHHGDLLLFALVSPVSSATPSTPDVRAVRPRSSQRDERKLYTRSASAVREKDGVSSAEAWCLDAPDVEVVQDAALLTVDVEHGASFALLIVVGSASA